MKKLDFATTLTETQSYIGEQAGTYVLAAFLKNKTADSGVKIVEDIKKSAFVAKLAGSNLLQVGSACSFNASGTVTASEVELTPKEMHIDIELCYSELEALWNGLNNANMNSQDLSADFNAALQAVLIDAMNQGFETAIWTAVYDNTGSTITTIFDGISVQITTNVVSGSTSLGITGLTKSNIISAVDALVAKLPSVVLEDVSKLKLYMNPKTSLYYQQALMALGFNNVPTDAQKRTYDGIPIYEVVKIADNTMYAIQPDNIAIGVGAMDNFAQLLVLDMRKITGDNTFRMKLQGKADVKVIKENEAAKFVIL